MRALDLHYSMLQNPGTTHINTSKSFKAIPYRHQIAARGAYKSNEKTFATWYDALSDESSIEKAVHYVLSNEQLFLNSTGDIDLLPLLLKAAEKPIVRPTEEEMKTLVEKEGMKALFV
jgi:hypothetical protein